MPRDRGRYFAAGSWDDARLGSLGDGVWRADDDPMDNGPEFTGQALDAWVHANGVRLDFIEPGKPTQNGLLESFNGKFRDECLHQHWFHDLADARRIVETWRIDDNHERPHSALGDQSPAGFAARLRR